MNRKGGAIEKVFTGIPVMLIVVLLIGVFVFLSFTLSHTKDLTKYQYFSKDAISSESILFKNIELNNEKTFISREIIKEYNSKCYDKDFYELSNELNNILIDFMNKDKLFDKKRSCLMLDIGDLSKSENNYVFDKRIGSCVLYLIKGENNIAVRAFDKASGISTEQIGLSGRNIDFIDLNLNGNDINIAGYYGEC